MFSSNKGSIEKKQNSLQDKSKDAIKEVATQIKERTEDIKDSLVDKTDMAQMHANNLIDGIRNLLNEYSTEKVESSLKNNIAMSSAELQNQVKENVSRAYKKSKERTAEVVQENPIGSLLVVGGLGLLCGYLLGSKSKR